MGDRLKVAGLTGSIRTPSARFRVGQFIDPLANDGIELDWRPAPVSGYPPVRQWLRPFWLPLTLAGRAPGILASHRADVTLFNRELVSTLATLEGWTGRPRVLDVDDAIWLRRGGGFARKLAGQVDLIVAGNDFVADWFRGHNRNVEILPTAVDTERFRPARKSEGASPVVVGWSGTAANFPYLESIQPGLAALLDARDDVVLRISSSRRPDLSDLPTERVEFVPWSAATEVDFFQSLDIGLMPMDDSDWARGKCAYKMLLYLACGVPSVVSPVGMNAQVLSLAEVGRGPVGPDEWTGALLELVEDEALRRRMGRDGRRLVEDRFSVRAVSPQLADLLRQTAGIRKDGS